jgi:hypothetical protein
MSQRLAGKRGAKTAQPLGSSPDYRWNAVPSTDRVSVLSGVASWEAQPDPAQGAAARLAVTVHVRGAQQAARVWLDVYAFDSDGGLVSFDTHDLQHAEPAAKEMGGGELFVLDAPVWGPGLTSSSVMPTPAPRRLKYRVYVRPEAGLFTDGLLHDLALPEPKGGRARKRVPPMTAMTPQPGGQS